MTKYGESHRKGVISSFLHRRPLLLFVLALGLGLALRAAGGTGGLLVGVVVPAALVAARPTGRSALVVALGLLAGALRGRSEPVLPAPPPPEDLPRLVHLVGHITAAPIYGEADRILLRLATEEGVIALACTAPAFLPARGQRVAVEGMARATPPTRRPGPSWRLASRGVNVKRLAPAPWYRPAAHLDRLRGFLHRRLTGRLENPQGRALALCLLLGDGSTLSSWDLLHFRHTGTAHLLVVSGLHVALLGGLILLLTRGRGGAAVVVALGLYAALAGGRPPAVRAALGFAAWVLAPRWGRRADLATTLAFTALPVLLLEPDRILGPSFQISYGAVASMGLLGPACSRLLSGLPPALARALGWSLAASLGTAPLTLWHFGLFSPWSIPLTPLLTPFLALLVLLATLAPWVPDLAGPLLATLQEPLTGALALVNQLPATPLFAPAFLPAPVVVGAALVGLPLLARPRWRPVALLLPLVVQLLAPPPPPPALARGRLLDAGHGQCLLLDLPGVGLVISDAGSLWETRRTARSLHRTLRRWGRRRIALLTVSHLDRDHTSLLPALLGSYPVERVYLPEQRGAERLARRLRRLGCTCTVHAQGWHTTLRHGPTALHLSTPGTPGRSRNAGSLVLHVAAPGLSLLSPGDLEGPGLAHLVRRGGPARAAILVAPHHGAANGGEEELVQAWGCRTVLISRPWRRGPAPVAAACLRAGARVRWTGREGDMDL